MTGLSALNARDVIAKLRAAGFVLDRMAEGSHEIWYNPVTKRRTTVPNHPGTLPKGTLRAIIAQAGMTADEFLAL